MLVERSLWKFFRYSPTFLRVFGKGDRIGITFCLFFPSRHPPHYFHSDCSCDHELRGSCALDKLGNGGLIISGNVGCKTSRSKWLYDGAQQIVLVESGWRASFSLKNINIFKNHFLVKIMLLGSLGWWEFWWYSFTLKCHIWKLFGPPSHLGTNHI